MTFYLILNRVVSNSNVNSSYKLTYVTFNCNPFQVESGSKQGKWLLYLTDAVEISPAGVGKCFVNPRNINSLGLRYRQRHSELVTKQSPEPPLPSSPVMATEKSSQSQYKYEEPRYNTISGENLKN